MRFQSPGDGREHSGSPAGRRYLPSVAESCLWLAASVCFRCDETAFPFLRNRAMPALGAHEHAAQWHETGPHHRRSRHIASACRAISTIMNRSGSRSGSGRRQRGCGASARTWWSRSNRRRRKWSIWHVRLRPGRRSKQPGRCARARRRGWENNILDSATARCWPLPDRQALDRSSGRLDACALARHGRCRRRLRKRQADVAGYGKRRTAGASGRKPPLPRLPLASSLREKCCASASTPIRRAARMRAKTRDACVVQRLGRNGAGPKAGAENNDWHMDRALRLGSEGERTTR